MTSVPGYPPPATEPGGVARLLAGILGVFSAALVVAGTFLPASAALVTVQGRVESSFSVTAWDRAVDSAPQAEQDLFGLSHVARYGIPLTVTAVVLLIGAVLVFSRVRGAARVLLITGGAGVAAAVWTMTMDVSATLSYEQRTSDFVAHYTTGTGFWLLLGGGVVAALVLALAAFGGGHWSRSVVGYAAPGYPSPVAPQPYAVPPVQPPGQPQPSPASTGRPPSFPMSAVPQQPFPTPPASPASAVPPPAPPQSSEHQSFEPPTQVVPPREEPPHQPPR